MPTKCQALRVRGQRRSITSTAFFPFSCFGQNLLEPFSTLLFPRTSCSFNQQILLCYFHKLSRTWPLLTISITALGQATIILTLHPCLFPISAQHSCWTISSEPRKTPPLSASGSCNGSHPSQSEDQGSHHGPRALQDVVIVTLLCYFLLLSLCPPPQPPLPPCCSSDRPELWDFCLCSSLSWNVHVPLPPSLSQGELPWPSNYNSDPMPTKESQNSLAPSPLCCFPINHITIRLIPPPTHTHTHMHMVASFLLFNTISLCLQQYLAHSSCSINIYERVNIVGQSVKSDFYNFKSTYHYKMLSHCGKDFDSSLKT